VLCESCGGRISVGTRQARRIQNGPLPARPLTCRSCRGLRRAESTEAAFRYLADRFGVDVPRGQTARLTLERVVLTASAPDELASILQALR
jgi:hypothetical protein